MLTLAALRYKGLLLPFVSITASILSAAAERNIAPTFVGFITFSRTAIRLASLQISSSAGSCLRCIAHNIPLVSLNPVSFVRISNSAVYTGNSCIFFSLYPVLFKAYFSSDTVFSLLFFKTRFSCFSASEYIFLF